MRSKQDAPVIGIIIDGGELQYCRSYEPILVEVFDQDEYDAETDERRAEMDQTLAAIEAMPMAN